MSKIIKITAFFMFFVMCFCVHNTFATVASCSGVNNDGQTHYGTISGTCWAYYCSNGTMNKLSSVSASYCGTACSTGATQNKYTASGCTYSSTTRECCSDGNWSNWGEKCPTPCSGAACCTSSQCWTGSRCADMPGKQYNGKCFYTCSSWKCTSGSGWSCTGTKTYEKKYVQEGRWTQWGDADYNSIPSTTCQPSTKNYVYDGGSDAVEACEIQAKAVSGVPGYMLTTSCQVVGNCWKNSNNVGYKCQIRALSCTKAEIPCE